MGWEALCGWCRLTVSLDCCRKMMAWAWAWAWGGAGEAGVLAAGGTEGGEEGGKGEGSGVRVRDLSDPGPFTEGGMGHG
jgi:hypothetical protein